MSQLKSSVPRVEREANASSDLAERYRRIRGFTETLCAPLAIEDQVVQSMPDVSPTKWHRAHTTWFFETFVLQAAIDDYQTPDPRYGYLFNSYYNAVGKQFSRPHRGLLTRPTVEEVGDYRRRIDEDLLELLDRDPPRLDELRAVIELGLQHEQQHQELILTDIKHVLSVNPLAPVYRPRDAEERDTARVAEPASWCSIDEGVREIGHPSGPEGAGFAYDNERPRHRLFLHAAEIATRPVTCGEYMRFIDEGGYERAELWLSDGWRAVQESSWSAPLYWQREGGRWRTFTLAGLLDVDAAEPVTHVSFYEADAYARWAGARLPTEAEWEIASADAPVEGSFVESGRFHPAPAAPAQMLGDVWEWTASPYTPYPGFAPPAGALGEYNAKFMCSQMVLRGGSCATSRRHIRATYRNFFPPPSRWQFSGLRLARDT